MNPGTHTSYGLRYRLLRLGPHLGVMLFFALITVAMTWPLALHLSTSVIGPFRSDNYEYIWKIYWVKHALFDLRQSPWLVADIYYPSGYLLAFGEITPLHTFWGLPVTLLVGEVASYNLFILISTVLSGYFTYVWLWRLTGNRAASVLGGLIFAFCPYRMARIAGHLPLVSTGGFPLFFLGAENFAEKQKPRDALLMGIGFAISTLSSWYYGMILTIMGVIYLLVRVSSRRAFLKMRTTWIGLGVFTATVVLLVGPFTWPYLSVAQSGAARIPLEMADFWSASLLDFFLPNVRHPLWGEALQTFLPTAADGPLYEFILGLGLTTGFLALYGWRWAAAPAVRGLRWVVVASLVLSMGMTLHLTVGLPIAIPVPESVAAAFNSLANWLSEQASLLHEPFSLARQSSVPVPLPGLLLRWFVPGMGSMRSWGRFAVAASLGLAVLAGLGLDSWYRRELLKDGATSRHARRGLWLAAMVFAALVLFEFWTGPQPLVRVEPRPVDEWLAEQPGQFAIMQYPIHTALSGDQMLYTRYHGKRVVFGYGTYLPILFAQRHPELAGFPDSASLDRLSDWTVRYVLVDLSAIPPAGQNLSGDIGPDLLAEIASQPRLELTGTFDTIQVYRLQR